jgi:spermidine/putrescine transport system substrate-binding protein
MMPVKVEHPYAAETMMNYLYDPEVAAKLAAYVNYFSPVKGVREILEKTDAELAANPLIFPPDDVKARLYTTPAVTAADQRAAQKAMAEITGS